LEVVTWKKIRSWGDNTKMWPREIGCEDGRCIDLIQDCVQCRALILAVWNICVLLSNSYLHEEYYLLGYNAL
jgi:hypothetical protein